MGAIGFGPRLAIGAGWARARAFFAFDGPALPDGATLTRGSPGACFDSSGLLVSAANDVARFDHDPVTRTLKGLLIELERTNDILGSEDASSSIWTNHGASVTADFSVSPDGNKTADQVADSDAVYRYISQSLTPAARTFSVFVEKDSIGRAIRFPVFQGASGSGANLFLDTSTGEWSTDVAGGAVVEDCGTFWRISARAAANAAFIIFPAIGASASWAQSATATGSVVIWGMQAERGDGATSYIPTTDAAVTRAADHLTLDWGGLGVGDGDITVRYTFDDGSTQDVATTVAGGLVTVPTTLDRPWLRRAEIL